MAQLSITRLRRHSLVITLPVRPPARFISIIGWGAAKLTTLATSFFGVCRLAFQIFSRRQRDRIGRSRASLCLSISSSRLSASLRDDLRHRTVGCVDRQRHHYHVMLPVARLADSSHSFPAHMLPCVFSVNPLKLLTRCRSMAMTSSSVRRRPGNGT
jgi:hypothetical protein